MDKKTELANTQAEIDELNLDPFFAEAKDAPILGIILQGITILFLIIILILTLVHY